MTKLLRQRVVAETVRSGSGEIVQIVESVPDGAPASRAERFAALEREVRQLDDANEELAASLGVQRVTNVPQTTQRGFMRTDGKGVDVHNVTEPAQQFMPTRPYWKQERRKSA